MAEPAVPEPRQPFGPIARFADFCRDTRFGGGSAFRPLVRIESDHAPARGDEADGPPPHQSAWEAGHAAGYAAAERLGEERLAAERRACADLRLAFRALDLCAQDVLAEKLAATVEQLCADLFPVDADSLRNRCREAAALIGAVPASLVLHLHPEDAELFADADESDWQVVPDPAVARGGLLLRSGETAVSCGVDELRACIRSAFAAC
ncbi:hypothetical protein EYB45_00795 [Erythrobacteraceae bacterium CFH 75059]|uniref:FliH/SctL family protein n=1 Tax=Qipengyuania thermophila TaxID=2509361 RepID=UPI00101F0E56|nr:FliH/SctL family protein [Qipengyuania thermophila]TCD06308.1 hypothetical protein EYB45_00795 [Erythrobacteraceae bacterium CFH 75059]